MSYVPLLLGGSFALAMLVLAGLLDFLRRGRRQPYDVYSPADSWWMFYMFLGVGIFQWLAVIGLVYGVFGPMLGWSLYALLYFWRLVLVLKDFVRRRTDMPNVLFRMAQYEFLLAMIVLVGVSYYVHAPRR